jgi:branched-chain amino acid transport system permease protein
VDLVLQLLVNGLVNGSHYALLGLSFGLIFGTTRITHFAYGSLYALSAYACWWVTAKLGLPLVAGFAAGIAAGAAAGLLSYGLLYRPFERAGSPPLVILIASLGLFIVVENAIGIVFGTDTKVVHSPPASLFLVGPAAFTSVQLAQLGALVVIVLGLWLFLSRTRFGRAVRAQTDNPEMATIIGIDTVRLSALVFALGSAIAAVPACLILVKDGGTAYMGFLAVFMGFVAVVVGGIGSLRGAVAGGYALGLVESLGLWKIPSEWQNTIAFVVLFMVLLFRPQGLFAGRQ